MHKRAKSRCAAGAWPRCCPDATGTAPRGAERGGSRTRPGGGPCRGRFSLSGLELAGGRPAAGGDRIRAAGAGVAVRASRRRPARPGGRTGAGRRGRRRPFRGGHSRRRRRLGAARRRPSDDLRTAAAARPRGRDRAPRPAARPPRPGGQPLCAGDLLALGVATRGGVPRPAVARRGRQGAAISAAQRESSGSCDASGHHRFGDGGLPQSRWSASFPRSCSTALVCIWQIRLSVTPSTWPISASVRPS
jgi:hypothetical protein